MKGHTERAQFPGLMTPGEVAALFRVDPKTVARWAKAGKLSAVRTLGAHRRYRESEVRALLDQGLGQFRVRYLAPGSGLGDVPAVYGVYEGRLPADAAMRCAVRDGVNDPWIERWDPASERWKRVTDAS